jgi:hypothetical protein
MRRALLAALFALAAVAAAGCHKQVKKDGGVCPDSPEIHCVGDPVCSIDRERGCEMCQCEDLLDGSQLSEPPDSTPTRPPE